MNIASQLFQCFVKSIQEEIKRLQECGVLDHCHAEQRGRAYALNCVLREDTLRFLALRELYKAAEASRVTFQAECSCDEGRIDLVLAEGAEQYAFEFKRWQEREHERILGNDHKKLLSFMRDSANHHGYSVIFTDNENKGMPEEFQHDKEGFYKKQFEQCLGEKYRLCEYKVIEFDTFTVCAQLATPKQDAHGA